MGALKLSTKINMYLLQQYMRIIFVQFMAKLKTQVLTTLALQKPSLFAYFVHPYKNSCKVLMVQLIFISLNQSKDKEFDKTFFTMLCPIL